MSVQREFIFVNDTAYNIHSTMSYIENLYHNERTIVDYRYESIMAMLSDFKFPDTSHNFEFIEHPYNGIFIPIDLWLREFGIEEPVAHWILPYDDTTVGTFDVTISDDDSEDECIDSDDEEDMIIGVDLIRQLNIEHAQERGLEALQADFDIMGAELDMIQELGPDNDGFVSDE